MVVFDTTKSKFHLKGYGIFIEENNNKEIFELKIEKLTQSLKELDVEEKSILLMKYQDEFSIKEISETLEIGESATKMRLNRAKNRLLKIYNAL